MASKYDKVLSNLLAKFNTNSDVEEEVRRIVKGVIDAEINKLDYGNPYGIIDEIESLISQEAEQIKKK